MAAYHQGYDSHHLHADCKEPGSALNQDQLWNPTLGNQVWATFTFSFTYQSNSPTAMEL